MDSALALMCVKIFFCRIADVSLGTVRTVLTVKEKTLAAAFIGFIEVLLWFLIVREALSATGNGLITGIAYAAGFATGTYIGGKIARKFIKGNVVVQVVTTSRNDDLVRSVRAAGFGVSVVDVNSSEFGDEKYMLFCEIGSRRLKDLKKLVHSYDSSAFIMVQDTKHVFNGYNVK